MANNVAVSEGAGKTIATEEISGVQHQLIKLEFGAAGTATKVSDSDPLPVTMSNGSTAANQSTIIGYIDGIETLLTSINNDIGLITGINHGVKTVTTAGTDVALAASTACKKLTIQAQTDNTGLIAVGGSGVDATVATGTGIILYPGDVYEMEIDNLADIYIDSTVNGEGVRFTYFT